MRLIVTICSFLSLCACDDKEKTSLAKDHALVLVTSADNPPFEFHRTESNAQEITGFDIEIAKEIVNALNKTLEVKDMDFNSLIPALQAGRADFAMAALAVTDERKKNVDFSRSYFEAKVAVITHSGIKIAQDADLRKKKIGVQLGSTHEQVLKKIHLKFPDVEMVSLNRLGELVQELRAGRLDGVLTEESVAKAYVGSNKDIDFQLLQGYQSAFAIALPKGSPLVEKINQALDKLERDGVIRRLRDKWFNPS